MRGKKLFLFWLLLVGAGFSAKGEEASSYSASCAGPSFKQKRESRLWALKGPELAAAGSIEVAPLIPAEQKVSLTLLDQPKVQFMAKPEKSLPLPGNAFAGVYTFKAPASGDYDFSMSERLWVDVIELPAKKVVKTVKFERQEGCGKIYKILEFSLRSGQLYGLQLSSSPGEKLELLISAISAP